jgi:uncharacterized protein YbbK (DUF523 family)
MKDNKPRVGVSRCLLGDAVRYDGQSKVNTIVLEKLSKIFYLVAVCPEVEAGLSIPRTPVQLTASIDSPKITGRNDSSLDITDLMQDYCKIRVVRLNHLSGFIFKSRSPSCGLNSTPVYIDGHCVTETGRGIFANYLCKTSPNLVVIEDTELEQKSQLDLFIQSVIQHHTGFHN